MVYTASTLLHEEGRSLTKPEIRCNHSKRVVKGGRCARGNLAKMKHAATGKEK